jgi:hypothetical protein
MDTSMLNDQGLPELGSSFTGLLIFVKPWRILRNANGYAEFSAEMWDLNEMLRFTRNQNGTYKIKSLLDGKALDAGSEDISNGTEVRFNEDSHAATQQWIVENQSQSIDGIGPTIILRPNCLPRFALDADSYPHLWELHQGGNQIFAIQPASLKEHVRNPEMGFGRE